MQIHHQNKAMSLPKSIKNTSIAIIASEFNKKIVDSLIQGCLRGLKKYQITNSTIYLVPGAFEIPLMAKKIALSHKYQIIIALGAIIQGETHHYEHICRECASGIMQVQLETQIPIIFEVLMTKNEEQAILRSSLKKLADNKGYQAAISAVKLLYVH